jgi:hypothetical protein
LLDLFRPDGQELDRDEAQALEGHLAVCPDCSGVARVARQFDRQLGRAMCQVEAPPSLRANILSRMDTERGSYYRRKAAWGTRVAVGLAACLLLSLWLWNMHVGKKPYFNVAALRDELFEQQLLAPNQQKVDEFLAYHHVAAPSDFNYKYLVHYGTIDCQGKQVPFLLFTRPEQDPQHQERNLSARVYIVSDDQFDPRSLQPQERTGTGGYSTEVRRPSDGNYAYVIIYTGEDPAPFLANGSQQFQRPQ